MRRTVFCADHANLQLLRQPRSAVHLTKVRTAITARTALFSYYKELYEQLGQYEENKLQIFKYLISSSET